MEKRWTAFGNGEDQTRPKFVIIGIGGAGCNILRRKVFCSGHTKVAIGDDKASLLGTKMEYVPVTIEEIRALLSASSREREESWLPSWKAIAKSIKGKDLVIILAGMGGSIGGWGAPAVARLAGLIGAPSIALVTKPFRVEGSKRYEETEKQMVALKEHADGVVSLSNDALMKIAPNITMFKAFQVMDELMTLPLVEIDSHLTKEDLDMMLEHVKKAGELRIESAEHEGYGREMNIVEESLKSPFLSVEKEDIVNAILFSKAAGISEEDVKGILEHLEWCLGRGTDVLYGMEDAVGMGRRMKATILYGIK